MSTYAEWKISDPADYPWIRKAVGGLNQLESDAIEGAREQWLRDLLNKLRSKARGKNQAEEVLRGLAKLYKESRRREGFTAQEIRKALAAELTQSNVSNGLDYLQALQIVENIGRRAMGRPKKSGLKFKNMYRVRREFMQPVVKIFGPAD
ncbi:MAG: hypothetical protein Q7T26_02535 [Dehalococcoidia bacterium]|nr:hypothetical protein [Dehalococcoidia bacterium]